jgi:hypothetical protein
MPRGLAGWGGGRLRSPPRRRHPHRRKVIGGPGLGEPALWRGVTSGPARTKAWPSFSDTVETRPREEVEVASRDVGNRWATSLERLKAAVEAGE